MSHTRKRRKKKTGRNDSCPCGSGRKYKRCHGETAQKANAIGDGMPPEFQNKLEQLKTEQKQREKQQGKGRPIISSEFQGYRLVAVGDSIQYSKSWKSFHDFLLDYMKVTIGRDWGNREIAKPLLDRHPILQWYDAVCSYQKKTIHEPGKVHSAPMTGAVSAYLGLAYNLYLLAHNVELQSKLIERLRHKDQFHGAYYETYVAAYFILSGFDIELEDEGNPDSSHCEFVAKHKTSTRKFSVEAKARMPGKAEGKVNTQLRKALKKDASHDRIVFIDVNMPEATTDIESSKWINEAVSGLRAAEDRLTINGNPAPPAYVILTNHPFTYNLESSDLGRAAIGEGFKIPDFRYDASFADLRSALESRESHREVFELLKSLNTHSRIPSTFDGENPDVAFGNLNDRLLVGNRYSIPNQEGGNVEAILRDVTVNEGDYSVYCIFELSSGKNIISKDQLSEGEIAAYNAHPDTFFGFEKHQNRKIDDPIDTYDFFYESYKNTPKEKLIELMGKHPEQERLVKMNQEELAKLYCEGLTYTIMKSNNGN
jgi:hypothetical protein